MSSSSYVFGKNSVRVLLESNPKRVQRIYVGDFLKPDKRIDAIYQLSKANGLTVQKVGRAKLDQLMADVPSSGEADDSHNHQGVVAVVAPKAFLSMPEVLKRCETALQENKKPLLLMLDGVTDPRNLGAILRVADGAGISAVILQKNYSAALGPAAAKTASGAEESVDICLTTNLSQSLEALKKAGFWVVGSTGQAKAQHYDAIKYDMPTVLVMGSEGDGMRQLTEKTCDFLVKIPMAGVVDSLNVSVATGILSYHIRNQQRTFEPQASPVEAAH